MINILANSEGSFIVHMLGAFALAFAAVIVLKITEWASPRIKSFKNKK